MVSFYFKLFTFIKRIYLQISLRNEVFPVSYLLGRVKKYLTPRVVYTTVVPI